VRRCGHIVFESVHVTRRGEPFPVEVSSRAIRYAGHPAVLSIARDISERKRIEAEKRKLETSLIKAQKLETIGTLAGGIAHDFNNILSPIIGYAEMIQLDVPGNSVLYENVQEILKAAGRARNLVQQILAFGRQGEQAVKPVQMRMVVKEVLTLLKATLPSTITVRQDIAAAPVVVHADPGRLHQVIMNLCTNAFHAMEDTGGTLTVSLKSVDLEPTDVRRYPGLESGSYGQLSVSDTGSGIAANALPKIFDPYFTTKAPGKGTGLGLAVVHGIVTGYGGYISVYSEPGQGTTFHVFLPRVVLDAAPAKETSAAVPMGDERILLVDDEEQIVQMEKQMLERLGYDVSIRTSSIEALEAFRAQPHAYDLVITDMTMPNITGDKLSQKLKHVRPDIPIILCTGFSERISVQKAGDLGIRGFLFKPITRLDFAQKIREVLD